MLTTSTLPTALVEKIHYVRQRFQAIHEEVGRADNYQLKMSFNELVDNTISHLIAIAAQLDSNKALLTSASATPHPGSPSHNSGSPSAHQGSPSLSHYHQGSPLRAHVAQALSEKERMDYERVLMEYKLRDLDRKQQQLDFDNCRLQLDN